MGARHGNNECFHWRRSGSRCPNFTPCISHAPSRISQWDGGVYLVPSRPSQAVGKQLLISFSFSRLATQDSDFPCISCLSITFIHLFSPQLSPLWHCPHIYSLSAAGIGWSGNNGFSHKNVSIAAISSQYSSDSSTTPAATKAVQSSQGYPISTLSWRDAI